MKNFKEQLGIGGGVVLMAMAVEEDVWWLVLIFMFLGLNFLMSALDSRYKRSW